MKLTQSPVQYNREAHTYTLNGVCLDGITKVIKYQLQPDSYNGISEETLAKAAVKGSLVHDLCEDYDNWGNIPTELDVKALDERMTSQGYPYAEVYEACENMRKAIKSVLRYSGLVDGKHQYLASEYVVSDNKHFASPIDKVFLVDEHTVDIGDIKTISKLDKAAIEKVTWQCSIYAKWFEEMNPGIKVRNLYCIWLPDSKYWTKTKFPSIKTLERVPDEEVDKLLRCEVNDEKYRENSVRRSERDGYSADVVKAENPLPAEITAMKQYVINTMKMFKTSEAEKKAMVEKVKDAMAHFNVKSWATEEFSFTQSADSEIKTLDIDKLKADHPEIDFDKYYKVSTRKGGFTAKLK